MQTGVREYQFDVFLSHNSKDKEIVRRVAFRLKDSGIRVWFDEWAIAVGDDVYLSIEHGLEKSRILALFISKAALGSDWVSLERSAALFRDPANRSRRFISVLLDDCDMPDALRRYRYLDFRRDFDTAAAEFIRICETAGGASGSIIVEGLLETYLKDHIEMYASLTSGRIILRSRAIGLSGQEVDAESEIRRWLTSTQGSRLAVLGEAGAGKTYLLRRVCSSLAELGDQTPVFVNAGRLRTLGNSLPITLLALTEPPVPDDSILELTNVVVMMDGLDELVGSTQQGHSEFLELLDSLAALCPPKARVVLSSRSTTYEVTGGVISKAFSTRPPALPSADRTDVAISAALAATKDDGIDRITLLELSASEARTYLSRSVGRDLAGAEAAAYVLNSLPRSPMTLRFLELALPELRPSTGKVELDHLYSVAL